NLARKHTFVKEVRGLGLILGMELDRPGGPIVDACIKEGFLINCAHDTVLRFLPPLIVGKKEIDLLIETLDRVFDQSKKET
ncbi:MAG: aminotransferase class III-fold pyridoxal phosphate-dependent enzyme, partial [Deltaproteobacteria bacterium]|nr:aminotransferase class III-fold pyridoxal phosphate-dependent enzyme [Deltaproteobacteria bacterium]